MINRRVTRVVLNSTERTALVSQPNGTGVVPVLTTTDFLYVGFHSRFSTRFFQVGVVNAVSASLVVEYWDGSTWNAVDDLLDQTSVAGVPFAQSGFISWTNKDNWSARSLTGVDSDVELFWVRLSWSQNLTAGLEIKSVLNTFNDDALLRAYFPELITDVQFLPSGKTNFLDQYVAAKDLVVLRLKQRKVIQEEGQIIDVNDVAVAATYGAAKIILQPIATSDATKELYKLACDGFDEELNKVSIGVDENNDGIVSEFERGQSFDVEVVRR